MLNDYEKNVKVIKNELNKISNIVSNFMLYQNSNTMINSTVNLCNIINENIEKFDVYSHIKFSFNCFSDLENIANIKISGDYHKVSMVLSNIYKNCVEAINHNNGIIETNISTKDDTIIVDIIDNGQGIEESLLEKVYEPFFTNKECGTGLGIPICKNIMKSLNGNFIIFNNRDVGCTTRIIFKMLI